MRVISRQSHMFRRFCQLLALGWLAAASGPVVAGESAVEPSGNGVDLIQDTTDGDDSYNFV